MISNYTLAYLHLPGKFILLVLDKHFKTLFYLSKNTSQYLQVVVFMGYHTVQYLRRIPTFRK